MTLVVGYNFNNKIALYSDCKITYPEHMKESLKENHLKNGAVKFKFISKNVVVAFAGNYDYADIAYKELKDLNQGKVSDILEILLRINKKSKRQTDFLLLTSVNLNKELIKIADKKVRRNMEYAWIGDFNVHREFDIKRKDIIKKGKHPDLADFYSILNKEFKDLVFSNKFHSVGTHTISLSSYDTIDGFHVIGESGIHMQTLHPVHASENKLAEKLDFGNEVNGAYQFNQYETAENCIVIYFEFGYFGIVFEDVDGGVLKAKTIKVKSFQEFDNIINSKYNANRAMPRFS